jgi:LuxR family maltose regulon positive regulatory protein
VTVAENQRRGGEARRRVPKPILATELAPPRLPSGYVPRARLLQLVTQGIERTLTLVSSHAGTGKTVLLAAWAQTRPDVAWLTVDRDDNWSPDFWRGVELALERVEPARPPRGADAPVVRISERLAARSEPIVLVLDDFQEIDSAIVLAEVEALIAHAPDQLRLVISTRADPRLRLQRLRLAGLTEIRAADLAFTLDECRELLGACGAGLSEDDVAKLRDRTEGWAAGLRLAALSLEREPEPALFLASFAGDERAIADYLLTEILERQPEARRTFLLRTSITDTITAGLAAALTPDLGDAAEASQTLHSLAAENFLVSSHYESGDLYRYHALLRDFLRSQLAASSPDEIRELHLRAAGWFWDHGDAQAAFDHAVAGRDWDLADELTCEAWHEVILGVAARAGITVAETPEAALAGRPGLTLRMAAAQLLLGDREGAEARVRAAGELVEGARADCRELLEPVLATFHLSFARVDGDFDLVRARAQEVLEAPTAGTFEVGRRARAQRAVGLANLGAAELAAGELDDAELHLDQALSLAREAGVDMVRLNALSQLALLEAVRGNLRRAAERGADAVDFAERRGWTGLVQLVGARLALAWAHFQWDEPEAARHHADELAELGRQWRDRTARVGSAVISALVLGAEGADGAVRGLRLVRGVGAELDGWVPPRFLATLLATAEPRLLASRGDLVQAEATLERRAEGSATPAEDALVRVRLHLAAGAPAHALAELETIEPLFAELEQSRQIEAQILTAVARRELNDREGAGGAIEHALDLAGPNSYRRGFLDGGPAVRALLVEQVRRGTRNRALVADLIAAFERRASSVEITKPQLLDPLSEREQAVLRYLPTMMSNAEIASELFVSVNTVKTHLKSIYRKLGTTRRRDAVERARRLDLL